MIRIRRSTDRPTIVKMMDNDLWKSHFNLSTSTDVFDFIGGLDLVSSASHKVICVTEITYVKKSI